MADFTTNRSSKGGIGLLIGAVLFILFLLYILVASGGDSVETLPVQPPVEDSVVPTE